MFRSFFKRYFFHDFFLKIYKESGSIILVNNILHWGTQKLKREDGPGQLFTERRKMYQCRSCQLYKIRGEEMAGFNSTQEPGKFSEIHF